MQGEKLQTTASFEQEPQYSNLRRSNVRQLNFFMLTVSTALTFEPVLSSFHHYHLFQRQWCQQQKG